MVITSTKEEKRVVLMKNELYFLFQILWLCLEFQIEHLLKDSKTNITLQQTSSESKQQKEATLFPL